VTHLPRRQRVAVASRVETSAEGTDFLSLCGGGWSGWGDKGAKATLLQEGRLCSGGCLAYSRCAVRRSPGSRRRRPHRPASGWGAAGSSRGATTRTRTRSAGTAWGWRNSGCPGSEERRGGEKGRSRGGPDHLKKKK